MYRVPARAVERRSDDSPERTGMDLAARSGSGRGTAAEDVRSPVTAVAGARIHRDGYDW